MGAPIPVDAHFAYAVVRDLLSWVFVPSAGPQEAQPCQCHCEVAGLADACGPLERLLAAQLERAPPQTPLRERVVERCPWVPLLSLGGFLIFLAFVVGVLLGRGCRRVYRGEGPASPDAKVGPLSPSRLKALKP